MNGEVQQKQPLVKTNYARRVVAIAVCFGPVGLLLVSLVAGFYYPRESALGVGLTGGGLAIAGVNLYLSFIRPALYVLRHGSKVGMRYVSGVPAIGTLLVVVGGVLGFGDWRSTAIGLAVLAADTGGLPWFLIYTWDDCSLWDA